MGQVLAVGVICLFVGDLAGVFYTLRHFDRQSKKADCENALVLRAYECKPYYLTTDEAKLLDRLGV